MRASRLLSILITLQLRGRVTARDLAAQFEVSRRTILRDVDELSAAGVPIYAERGTLGGFALLEGYRTDLTGLDADEREAMFLAGLPAAAADLGLSVPAATARLKLAAATAKGRTAKAADLADMFHLDPIDWYRQSRPVPHLRAVAEATWSYKHLRINYQSWSGRGWRRIAPLGLVLKAGAWYLVAAHEKHGPGIYRIDQILGVEPLDDPAKRPVGFDLAQTWQRLVTRFERSLARETAVVRFSLTSLDRVDSLGADAAAAIRATAADATGWREVTIPIETVDHTATLLLGFADQVEVIAPDSLREAVVQQARRIVQRYNGSQNASQLAGAASSQ